MAELQPIDYIVLLVYLMFMAGIGTFFGWFVKDVSAYFKGGNTIPWPVAGISNYMSLFSTFIFVAYAGIAYEHGLVAVTVLWSTVPACLLAAALLGPRWRRAGLTTPVEYLETRFNASVRQLFSWCGLFMRFLDNAVRLYAIGLFLSAVTPLPWEHAIVISALVITFYTVVGGLWAVTVMDTLQFVVLLFATLVLFPLAWQAVGGLEGIVNAAPEHLHWFNGPKGVPLYLLVFYVMIMLKYNANWAFIQRLYSVRDEGESRKVGLLCAALFVTTPILFLLPAIAARVLLPQLPDKEMAYVAVSARLLPTGMMGLMLAAMFSATMSSLNSEYNVMAGVLTNDIYKRLLAPNASKTHLIWVARLATVLVGLLIMDGALYVGGFGGAFEANKLFTGLFAIPLAVPLLLGLLFRRPKPMGAVVTLVGGTACGLILMKATDLKWEIATLVGIAFCVTVFMGSALLPGGNAEYTRRVVAFFDRLRQPLLEKEKPRVDAGFMRMLAQLFAVSLAISGVLFTAVSSLSIGALSGRLGVGAGLACLSLGFALWIWKGRKKKGGRTP